MNIDEKILEILHDFETFKLTEDEQGVYAKTTSYIPFTGRIKSLNLPIVVNWVACKDELPIDQTKQYLVIRCGEVNIETWHYRNGKGFWYNYLGITEWKELPEPPCL